MNPERNQLQLRRTDWIIIIFAWALIQIIFLSQNGINDHEEAVKYISISKKILSGTMKFSLPDIWYSGYIALHVLIASLGMPAKAMYAVQLILSFISLIYFLKILSAWVIRRFTLLLCGLLYSTCSILQHWVPQLYTDTIFFMLLIIGLYYLINADRSSRHYIICWVFVLLLPFFRPVGLLFVLLACIHWIIVSPRKNLYPVIFSSGYIFLLLFLGYKSLTESTGYFYAWHNAEANIICGYPSGLLKYQVQPYQTNTSIIRYLTSNPEMTIRLFLSRFLKVFDLTRPFFSFYHNAIVAVECFIYYCLATFGVYAVIKEKRRDQLFLFAGILLFSIPSVIFCVEWHGRMSLPVICFVLLLAGKGLDFVLDRKILN